jgi:hypothetical protein
MLNNEFLSWHFQFHTEEPEAIYHHNVIIFLFFSNNAFKFNMLFVHTWILHLPRMEGELKEFELQGNISIFSLRKFVSIVLK